MYSCQLWSLQGRPESELLRRCMYCLMSIPIVFVSAMHNVFTEFTRMFWHDASAAICSAAKFAYHTTSVDDNLNLISSPSAFLHLYSLPKRFPGHYRGLRERWMQYFQKPRIHSSSMDDNCLCVGERMTRLNCVCHPAAQCG